MNLYIIKQVYLEDSAHLAYADNEVDARTVYVADTLRMTGDTIPASEVLVVGVVTDPLLLAVAAKAGVEHVYRDGTTWYWNTTDRYDQRVSIAL